MKKIIKTFITLFVINKRNNLKINNKFIKKSYKINHFNIREYFIKLFKISLSKTK